ncbi:MAG: hypothetical protein FWE22_01835 [Firmicutes bacterium]|nr:hypothetical protein [Bacillota bacterium]
MNWLVIWGIIKFDKNEHIVVPKNFFSSEGISVRFSKDKSFSPASRYGRDVLKLNKNEISFEIMCSAWKPKNLQNNEEEWCTSDMDYFCPDEIGIEQQQQFSKVSKRVYTDDIGGLFIRKDIKKKEWVYAFDSLHVRLKDLQNIMTDIANLPNIKKVIFYFTDSHGDVEIENHELWDWKIEEFANRYLNFCLELIEEGYYDDTLSSYYLTYEKSK